MEISTEILIKIAQLSTPETRMNLFEAYPRIFDKKTRDYIRIENTRKYFHKWKNNVGYWSIYWDRIPDEPISIHTEIYTLFPEFQILQNKRLYELFDMPIYKLLISSLSKRCYCRKYLYNITSNNEYKQWIIGIIAKYSMRYPFQISTIRDLLKIIYHTSCNIVINHKYIYNEGRYEIIFNWYSNAIDYYFNNPIINLKETLSNIPQEVLLEILL